MIIVIRGTSGSGKSHIVYDVIKALGPYHETFPLGEKGKLGGYTWGHPTPSPEFRPYVAIIGRYETACGGCDCFSWPGAADEVAAKARELESQGYAVLLEGLIVSAWATDRMASLGPGLHTIHLTTPLENCLAAVQDRRDARAAAKGKDASPLNPENTTKKWHGLHSCTRRQREAGMPVEELDRERARDRVFELLGLKVLEPA